MKLRIVIARTGRLPLKAGYDKKLSCPVLFYTFFPVVVISHSAAETVALGESWAREARAGWVIGLTGDLGAGKTQLVKGLARGLGATERVHSPTFALVNEYTTGRLPLYHLDLYRLDTPEQIRAAGLEQFLSPDGVTVIEWVEKMEDGRWKMEDGKCRMVKIETVNETERRITYEDFGA